jgi:hypothetical protein
VSAHAVAALEAVAGPSFAGSVLADVGGDVGALVLYVPEVLDGLEIELRPSGRDWDGTHTAVRPRVLDHGVVWAAFFGSLPCGRYDLRVRGDDTRHVTVAVDGGHVSEHRW